MRLEEANEGKINVKIHLEGWHEDGENMNERIHEGILWVDRRGCNLGAWNGRMLLE